MLTTSFTDGLYKFTDGEFISPSVPMDNLYLPIVNCLTIGTDGTDEQCFPSVPMDNLYLPMGNCLTIGTDGTDGQCFGGLPYAIAIMLTISFTDGLFKFTDGKFISPSVRRTPMVEIISPN